MNERLSLKMERPPSPSTCEIIQILQQLLLSGEVQREGVEGVRQVHLGDQHLG